MDTKQWLKDRNEAFISMNEKKIKIYCKKYGIEIPEDKEIFWMGVHKVICNWYLNDENLISQKQYDESFKWLAKHGTTPSILGGDE